MIMTDARYIDSELLKTNCAGDLSMMKDLINMGILSVETSLADARHSIENNDMDKLARVFHKLRPVLCYCGINNLTDELLQLEEDARQKKDLPGLVARVNAMLDTLQHVHNEMKHQLTLIAG